MLKRHPLPWFRPSAFDPCFCGSDEIFGQCCGLAAAERKPPAGALVFPGFIDPVLCTKWVKKLESKPGFQATVNVISQARAGAVQKEKNPMRVCSNVNPGVLRKVINDRVQEAFQLASARVGRTIAWFEKPSILRYTSGGFYKRHADSCLVDAATNTWMKVHDRDISLLIYLNEDYTGGGLSFMNFNYHLRPKTGDMLAFPSDNRYEHQAQTVQSGIRYVIVSWAAFNGSERVLDGPPAGSIVLP
jgi:predicted 2-oxoglutarate/Fe(II)-dependent dioxygenase YbiX